MTAQASQHNGPARRVLVFEPDPLLRELLVHGLRSHGFHVEGADTPQVAWSEMVALDPDAVVLEANINSCESGPAYAEAMLQQSPGMGLVFLTNVHHPRLLDPQRADLPSGSAYLHKSRIQGLGDVLLAIEAVLRESPDIPRHDHEFASGWGELSSQQIDVLRLIAEGHSNREIAELRGTQVRSVEALIGRTFDQLRIATIGPEGNRRVLAARHYLLACNPRQAQRTTAPA